MNIKELKEYIKDLPDDMEIDTYWNRAFWKIEITIYKKDNTIFIS